MGGGLVCHAQDEGAPATVQPAADAPAGESASPPQRFVDSVKRLFSVEALTSTLPGAVLQQWHDWPGEWGRNGYGFGKRAASLYGQFVIGVAIQDSIKALDHEDTRYHRLGRGNFFRRTAHVVTGTLVVNKREGGRMFAWSVPANAYGSWAVATLWSPREYRNGASIMEWGSAGVGTMALGNFAREFWPDVKGIFHHKPTDSVTGNEIPRRAPSGHPAPRKVSQPVTESEPAN